jgi:hypothetical protein
LADNNELEDREFALKLLPMSCNDIRSEKASVVTALGVEGIDYD